MYNKEKLNLLQLPYFPLSLLKVRCLSAFCSCINQICISQVGHGIAWLRFESGTNSNHQLEVCKNKTLKRAGKLNIFFTRT